MSLERFTYGFQPFSSRASSCNSGVSVVSLWGPTSALERSLPPTPVAFFSPSTFLSPHLFLLVLDTARPIPPPPFIPTAPPTLPPSLPPSTNPLSSTYCITIHLHFFDPFRAQRQALSLPWAPCFSTLTAPSVSDAVAAACCGRRALLFLHGECVFSLGRQ